MCFDDPEGPAFVTADRKALSKVWMLRRTSALLRAAGILLFGSLGRAVSLRSSSWRCGGVESAKAAGISDSLIMSMGNCDVNHCVFAGKPAVVAKIRRPKGTWWEWSMDVRCFSPPPLRTSSTR
jgi:hypothetical protein